MGTPCVHEGEVATVSVHARRERARARVPRMQGFVDIGEKARDLEPGLTRSRTGLHRSAQAHMVWHRLTSCALHKSLSFYAGNMLTALLAIIVLSAQARAIPGVHCQRTSQYFVG